MARLAKLDLPTSLPTDEPRVSICINRDWLSIIMNACTRLEWGASWRDGTNIDQAEQRVFDLYSLFRSAGDCGDMGCCDDLQTQIDDLLTQQQGNAAQNYQQAQAQAKLMHDRYQDIWDANPTPTAINPNAPTTNWNGANNAQDNNALCGATAAFVRNWATLKTQQFDIVFGSLLVALGIGFAFIPGLGWAFLAAVAITLSAAAVPVGLTYNTVREALTDEAALDAVACCMNNYLKNKAINQANFQNSLSSCGFAGGSYAAIVRDVLANDLAGNWLLFIDLVGQAKTELLAGRSVYCPCSVPCTLYNFRTGQNGFVPVVGGVPNVARGAYTGGTGFTQVNPNTYRECRIINSSLTIVAGTTFRIQVTIAGSAGDTCYIGVTAAGVAQTTSPIRAVIGVNEITGTFSNNGTGLRIDFVDEVTPYNVSAISIHELEICG